MPVYEYQGQFYELSEIDPAAAKNKILGYLKSAKPPPETTILGQVKEGFKGLIPGAVGLVESAATGASALLPEEYEKAAREKIASIAGAAKAPFAAAPGYEETIGRKLGEAVGSTVPFLAAGPLGLAGRVGAVGLGVGAGAGEARTRAEKEGATAEQRGTATALGIIPGAMEVFAPFKILSRIPEGEVLTAVQQVKRALVAGGEEAAQEAASGLAQNMIAKGVYKPEQELIEGLGEQAAYGGATGAIIQGLMDLALGRRARGPRTAAEEETPIEKARREAEAAAAAAPTPKAPPVEEPTVRKPGEPRPLPQTLDDETIRSIGFTRGKIRDALMGKAITDPEIRTVLEEYKQRPNASAKTAAKIDAFLARLPEAAAPPVPTPAPPAPVEAAAPEPAPVAPPPVVEAPVPPTAPPVEAPVGGAPAPAPITPAPTPEAPSVPTATTEPAPNGAGPGVAGGPPAVTPAAGVGGVEPTGVVPAAPDVGQPPRREKAAPAPVAAAPAPKPAPLPEYTEEDIDRAVATGLMTEEQAETYRAELREEEAPPTAIGAAFEKQVADIKAQMDALRQKNGKPPAPKSKNRAKYDELQAQLDALTPKEEGDLIERLEKIGATGVVGTRGERPIIDLDALRENLIKARAAPRLQEAILTYIGVDKDGNYLPTTYSREEAAEMAGLGRSSGANVTRTAQALGITADVVSRFHAGQTDIIVRGKNVSEAGTGATDLQPTRGVLYEAPAKGKAGRAAGFLRGALTSDGKLDFSNVPLNSKKATKDSPAVTGLAEIYARASNYDPKRGNNEEVIKQLNAEIAARTKADRKGMQSALDRAYRVVRAEEEAAAEQAETDRLAEEGVDAEDVEAEDKTRRLSDEEADDRYARGVEVESPDLNTEQVQALKDNDLSQAMALVSVDPTADRVHRAVAKRLAQLLDGTRVELVNNLTNDKGRPILGRAMVSGEVIQLDRDRGVTQEVLLHEGVHAAAERVLVADEKLLSPQQLAAKRELQKLFEAVQKDPDITSVDAKTSLSEFVAEVMSNRQLQGQLGKKPWRMSDAMQQFKSIVLRLLGVKDAKSMLASAMASVDAIFTPTSTQIGTTPTGTREARAPTDVIGERKERTLREDIGRELKGNKLLRLREKFTDSMAPVDDLFTNAYGGKVRDRMGNLNPMVLLSRALDALRISKAVQEQGGLTKVDGLWVAEERDLSYSKVLSRIAEEAKKQKKTYDKFAKELGTLLYAHREYNLREKNKTLKKEDQITLLLDDPTLDKLEADFQSNEFAQDVLKDLDTIRFDLIDKLVESGRISKETAQEWKDNTGYIPFERIGEYENAYASAKGANRGAAALKKMRALEGSKRQTVNPIENFSGLVDWMVKETIKNEASVRALDDMVLLGAAKKVPSADAVAKDAEGAVVQVYKDGAPVFYYLLDAAHLPTFSLIDRKVPNTFKLMQKGSQILRAGVTGMPPFAIKQVFDDIARAYAYAGVENNAELVKRILTNFPKNWFNEVFKRKTASAKEMERLGIVGTFDFSQTGNLQNIMEQAGAKEEGLGKAILRVMEAGAKASDLAVRQAIYDQVKKETGDTAAAESAAREIINFSRRGSSETMNLLISVIPFFNAYARGMDKLAVAAAGKTVGKSVGVARSMFYKRMGMLTAMGLLYALAMQDDEEYQSLPDHVRDTNWVLPGGKYLGYTPVIPVPAELAFFFKAIPERVVQYMKYQGTDEERAGIDLLGNMVMRGIDVFSSPNITPQVLRPMLENYINYSFFLGRPLESQAQQALEPYMREGMGTSDTMKALAKNINDFAESTGFEALKISPIKLENLVRGMLGTGAGLALSMADAVTNPDRTDRPLHQQLTPQLTGASALMKDSVGTRMMDEIYKLDRRTEQAHNSLNRLMKNNPEEIESYMEQNKGILGIRPAVQATMNAIRTLNEQARAIDKDKAMSSAERRELINELRVEQNNIAKTVFSLRKQARDIQYGL